MKSFEEIRRINVKGNVIPLAMRIPSDLETPVSAFMKLAAGRPYSFLLESIEGGEKLARYSFLGFDPFLIVEGKRDEVTVRRGAHSRKIAANPATFIKGMFEIYRPVADESLPRFTGGGVGYFSYDTVRWFENIPDNNDDELDMPEMLFCLYSRIVVFDHLKQEMILISNILHESGTPGLRSKYAKAKKSIEEIVQRLEKPLRKRKAKAASRRPVVRAHTDQRDYEKMVRKAKRYIKEGDIFQVVLSQRWSIKSKRSPLEVYRRLRRINPSPYMFLLNFGSRAVVGASPEMMVRIENDMIETRPIAGTRPRGRTEREDARLAADLMSDAKELAEHTMLLDLGRNDIGRVAKSGTVEVRDRMTIEKYSHVMHIVSSVLGKLRRDISPIDGHFACFPAGTVSGAPKIRAMEIIDELESSRRSVYAGSIAYLDFWGNLDSCIAIRTVVKEGDKYYVQAGAGIVADSRPRREFEETKAKASAIIEAIVGKDES